MAELDAKGRRVLGYFVFMLGAGLVLDSSALWYGVLVMIAGAACFAAGVTTRPPPGDAA
ncbi:MAG: hypothetical protein HY699_24025 [Deltaproteobacteria bacterium]|nr:hypothetical protein [Deltaproteobacteria bacterium]